MVESANTSRLAGRGVLVTGGLGFLGLNFVPALLREGAVVRILSRTLDSLALQWLDRVRGSSSVEVIAGDIADPERMSRWLDGVDVVLNLAAESGAVKSLRNAHQDMQVNIEGHLNVLDAIREHRLPPRVIFVSSRLVYGVTGAQPVDEDHPTRPTSLYGLHKLTVEHYYRIYHEQYGLPFVTLRLTNPYGPYQLPQRNQYGVINAFIMAARRGETLRVFGGGPQLRDYIHASDVAEAMIRAAVDDRAIGQVFNVGSGRPTALGAVARQIVAIAGRGRVEEVPWPDGFRKVETGDFVCDVSKIERTLAWRARTELEDGLRCTLASYEAIFD